MVTEGKDVITVINAEEQNMVENSSAQQGFVSQKMGQISILLKKNGTSALKYLLNIYDYWGNRMIQRWLGIQLRQPKGMLSKWVGIYMQRGNDLINRWTIDLMDIKEDDVLLEVGMGNGSTINHIVSNIKTGKVFGLDLSDEMVKEAEKLNKEYIEGEIVTLHKGDIISLPYKDSIFDKVFSVHTLYFWSDINQGFSEINRVLKPGGKLFLSITDKSQMEKMKRTKDFNLINIEEIDKLLLNHMFQTIKLHQKGVYWCIEATK